LKLPPNEIRKKKFFSDGTRMRDMQTALACRPDGDFGVYEMPTAFDDRGYPTSLSDVFCRGADGKKAEVLDSLRS
jgi:hypothetical protein